MELWISLVFIPGQFWPSGIIVACICLSVCVFMGQPWACLHNNFWPIQSRVTKCGPKHLKVNISIVLEGRLTLTFKVNFNIKSKYFIMPSFTTRLNTLATSENTWQSWLPRLLYSLHPLHILIHLECFTVPTVSRSQSSTYILIEAVFRLNI